MRLKWKDAEPMVISLLRDISEEEARRSERTRRYTPEDLIVWWNNAQVRLATQKPVEKHYLYAPEHGCEVVVPDFFYRPRGVFLRGNPESLPRLSLESYMFDPQIGYIVAEGRMQLLGINPSPGFLLAYHAYYPRIEDEDSWVRVPEWALEACTTYSAMQAVTQEMLRDARYRKFISKEDAGNPQQNPFIPVAEWLKKRFYEIINTHSDDDQGL